MSTVVNSNSSSATVGPSPAGNGNAATGVTPLLQVENVRKTFPKPDGSELLVLDGVQSDAATRDRSWGCSDARARANRRCCV